MTGGFELRETGSKGVGVFAAKPFAENDVIFEETPIVSAQFCWNEAYGYYACHHCLKPMESVEENVRRLTANASVVVPFPELCVTAKSNQVFCESCGVGFCSEGCKTLAEQQYHSLLCPGKLPAMVHLVETWKRMHYPPETTSISLIARIIAMVETAADRESLVQSLMSFSHEATDESSGLCLLQGKDDEDKIKTLQALIQETIPINHAQSFVSEEGLRSLFALIGRNGQGIGTSVFSEWVKFVEKKEMSTEERDSVDSFIDTAYANMNEHVGSFLNCEGSGLYKLQRCVNHSCEPNARINFPRSDHTLVLEATRPIAPGDEICISYLDECMLERSRHTRNKTLKEFYLFECKCDKCIAQSDQPDVTSEEESDEDDDDQDMES
uniref:SET and MYND domain-containing protein 5 n=2 Tax=Lygus hesperus TaxID=30085 RepID=A0A0A9WCY4_LYGHE